MHKHKFLLVLSGLLVCSLFSVAGLADVEDVIQAQKEAKRLEAESRTTEREILRGTKDGAKLGREEFIKTCAVCHGEGAKGDGLFSPQLTRKPTDLTVISKNNGGVFPFLQVYEIIDGRSGAGVHGSRTMPIWGGRYSAESWFDVSTEYAETVARGKIFELILFLSSIQED